MGRPGISRTTASSTRAVLALVLPLLAATSCGDRGTSGGYVGPDYAEPVVLASENGVLEVSLFARQGTANLNTVPSPVQNFLLFRYELLRGTASNGRRSDENLYPGPTLRVAAGEKLIVHLHNELTDLTIPDFFDPAFIAADGTIPLYPLQLTSAPYNLHTHGLHVSPRGNGDNVLLNIPAGYTNTYQYDIPLDHPAGLYWYHTHRHRLTAQETYLGLCGMLVIGRADGEIPAVTEQGLPIRTMALQFNDVFDRRGSEATLNNYTWPQYVSTLTEPEGNQLADGTYEPKLSPTNFSLSEPGTTYFTVWYTGALSTGNNRGEFSLLPQSHQSFTAADGSRTIAANPSQRDDLRDVQFTVNGLFQPVLHAKPGQTEIWALANVSDLAYVNVRLTETATGRHPPIAIVGVDGNPTDQVQNPIPPSDGTTLVIPPASRYTIAVTMPREGELVLEMPPYDGQDDVSGPGILYTSNGTEQFPGVLGTIDVDGSVISYYDGFFYYPTQVLARVEPLPGEGVTVPFEKGQPTGAYSSFVDTEGITPDVTRTFTVSGGFFNTYASANDPKAFVYAFNNEAFDYAPLIQPRLGSVEEWTFINDNNDGHPIHVHVNDFQVSQIVSPREGVTTGFQPWGQDNANLPVPVSDADQTVTEESKLSIRTKFQQYTGTFVTHCHRLNHEDNGMMMVVNVLPAVSPYAVAEPGVTGGSATVRVYDGADDRLVASVVPFPGFTGSLSAVMGDVDGDQVLDLVVGAGPGGSPEVVAFSGAAGGGFAAFERELVRFLAFEPGFRGGVSVAAADIDGNPFADNLIVGSGAGIESTVKVYGSTLPEPGTAPELFAAFSPYPGSTAGVVVTAALFDAMVGRNDIVTAPGPGEAARIQSFRYDLYTPNAALAAWCAPEPALLAGLPRLTSDFVAFDGSYVGGVSLGSGWIAGSEGGSQSLVVGQLAGEGAVRVYTTGSALFGQPTEYLDSPDDHDESITFTQVADFVPFPDAPGGGVRVATTADVYGADLLASGLAAGGASTLVRKYDLVATATSGTMLEPELVREVEQSMGTEVPSLGGN
mgnify:CR=1 FL=1